MSLFGHSGLLAPRPASFQGVFHYRCWVFHYRCSAYLVLVNSCMCRLKPRIHATYSMIIEAPDGWTHATYLYHHYEKRKWCPHASDFFSFASVSNSWQGQSCKVHTFQVLHTCCLHCQVCAADAQIRREGQSSNSEFRQHVEHAASRKANFMQNLFYTAKPQNPNSFIPILKYLSLPRFSGYAHIL